jgi:hypothetical protein
VNEDLFDVVIWEIEIYFVSNVVVTNKDTAVVVRITKIYGPPCDEGKQEFISELYEFFLNLNCPTTFGGF